jgi:hypothetical protein
VVVEGPRKSVDYYVKAIFPFECESEVVKVEVDPIIFDSARIEIGDGALFTNTTLHHVWYLNGEKISEERVIDLSLPGVYKLEIDTGGCVSWDTFEYVVLEAGRREEKNLIYPNPVRDELYFDSSIERVEICNSHGRIMISSENLKTVDVGKLASGMYYAILTGRAGKWVRKFVVCR